MAIICGEKALLRISTVTVFGLTVVVVLGAGAGAGVVVFVGAGAGAGSVAAGAEGGAVSFAAGSIAAGGVVGWIGAGAGAGAGDMQPWPMRAAASTAGRMRCFIGLSHHNSKTRVWLERLACKDALYIFIDGPFIPSFYHQNVRNPLLPQLLFYELFHLDDAAACKAYTASSRQSRCSQYCVWRPREQQ